MAADMLDMLTPIAFLWIIEGMDGANFSIIDQYDSTEVYASVDPHIQPSGLKAAAEFTRACYVADYCVLVARNNATDETIGWAQILLDRVPIVSDCSDNAFGRLVEQAIEVSNETTVGRLNLADVLFGEVTPENYDEYMENNNG